MTPQPTRRLPRRHGRRKFVSSVHSSLCTEVSQCKPNLPHDVFPNSSCCFHHNPFLLPQAVAFAPYLAIQFECTARSSISPNTRPISAKSLTTRAPLANLAFLSPPHKPNEVGPRPILLAYRTLSYPLRACNVPILRSRYILPAIRPTGGLN